MKCYLLSRDLMFSSQASGAATQSGLESQTIGSTASVAAATPSITILDLSMPGVDIAMMVADLTAIGSKVIAVGSHVHGDKLQVALDAGAFRVLTRGQAQRELATAVRDAQSS